MGTPILLVGNSPNQVNGRGRSWGELLSSLRGFAGLDPDDKAHNSKPFPLHFEEIRNRYLIGEPGRSDLDVVEKVSNLFKDLMPNDIHRELMALPFSDVLTTNYDDCLERSVSSLAKPSNFGINERNYSLFRRVTSGQRHIWHIRGEVLRPRSIVLGQDRYVESCSRMRRYMDGEGISFTGRDPVKAVFKVGAAVDPNVVHSWVDLFLTRDVHIVGFGMDYTEADIWYLLSYRARKHRSKGKWVGIMAETNVTFHMFVDASKTAEMQRHDLQKREVLESFGVKVVKYSLQGSSYEDQWAAIVNNLKQATPA